ncbi:head morphogenesis protein [Corallococcus sp. M34]|uniref:head morphogenesis protein n=1 Tax=Citreicoccus inhibens TaxID=2849499 RepID=UPI001C23E908|nr:head morphogenesis protein [Citreicoccus inhibens]MBU8900802.1 head morphogenesis protein [Citreicoccus inhibens]
MCTAPADSLLLLHEARAVADTLLGDVLRLPVAKALDVGTAAGMDRAVALLAARLRRAVGRADVDAMREAVAVLDVDWRTTTAAQRRRLVAQALEAAGQHTALIPSRIQAPLGDAAEEVVASTRSHARREQGLALAARFNAMDRRVAHHIVRTQGNFVRDEYGRRLDAFGAEARRLVAEGLEAGLERSDIAESLERAARGALIERAPFYWEVVAGSFVGQGRAFAQVSSYAEASIRRYRIEAVLDEATTQVCRYLHGRTFSVSDALRRFERVEARARPEDLRQELPWVRERLDADTGRALLYVNRGGQETRLAEVLRSAAGKHDDVGEFRSLVSDRQLADAGVGFPPFHALCRTTTLAVT